MNPIIPRIPKPGVAPCLREDSIIPAYEKSLSNRRFRLKAGLENGKPFSTAGTSPGYPVQASCRPKPTQADPEGSCHQITGKGYFYRVMSEPGNYTTEERK